MQSGFANKILSPNKNNKTWRDPSIAFYYKSD